MAGAESVSLGDLLKRYRIAAGLTQEELAERAGLSARAIRALENGDHRAPRRSTLDLLATALGLTSAERTRLDSHARQLRLPSLAHTRQAPPLRRPSTALVGRQHELALLNSLLSGEGPRLLLFSGEPGIGKSRLLQEAAESASQLGWAILSGGCHRRSGQEPYAPWMSVLARFLAERPPARQRLDLQGCAWLVKLLPELGERMVAPAPSWSLPVEQERRLMFAAVARMLTNVAGPAGTLVMLDDLHWAGVDALDLLAFLLREGAGPSVRFIAAYRDTDIAPGDPLAVLLADLAREGGASGAPLAPLDRDDAERLLTDLLTEAPDAGPDAQAEAMRSILARAGGVPFFLVSCAQEARLKPLEAFVDPGAVPWSAAESIRQRAASLPAPGPEILALAAVAGRQATRATLLHVAEALGHTEEATLRGLEAATRARLLTEDGEGGYAFAHDLIRETLEADLSAARRVALSRRVAEALERAPKREERAAELAWHFARGEEWARALPYALLAGDRASAAYAHAQAERHYQAAAEWAERCGDRQREGEALEKRADILYHLTRFTEAMDCLERAIRIYRDTGNWERLAWAIAQISRAGDPLGLVAASLARVEEFFTTLAAVADRRDAGSKPPLSATSALEDRAERAAFLLTPQTAARIYLCLTSRLLFLGRTDEIYGPSERTIQHARAAGDPRIESLAYAFRSQAQQAQGQTEAFTVSATLAHARALASGDHEALYVALGGIASLHELRAEPLRARDACLGALEATTQLGNDAYSAATLCNVAYFDIMLGEWDDAARHLERAMALQSENQPSKLSSPDIGLALLAALREERGHAPFEALARTERGSGGLIQWISVWAVMTLAELEILAGHASAAAARLRQVIEQEETDPLYCLYLYPPLAWAQLELGERRGAAETLAEARQRAGAYQYRAALVDIERAAALLALAEERWDDARRALEESLAICQAAPYPYSEAKARYVAGQLYAATGARARDEYQRALAICDRLGEWPFRSRIARALSALPDNDELADP
jgi:transcriptional regulator with XRE-family HTH domain